MRDRLFLAPLDTLLKFSGVYALNQLIGKPTTDRFRRLIEGHMADIRGGKILDIGCGIGNYRECFSGEYVGVDINENYIEYARQHLSGTFEVMDAANLTFSRASFDHAVTIATTHHLTDVQFIAMIEGALRAVRAGGAFHIIDAVLPLSPNFAFKRAWFNLDRGRHPRQLERMIDLAGKRGRVLERHLLVGPLHDTAYIRVAAAQ